MISSRFRNLALAALIGLLVPTTFGGAAGALAAHRSTRHQATHAHRAPHHGKGSRIPQHNRGDHDSDNRGGPSDGDGNV